MYNFDSEDNCDKIDIREAMAALKEQYHTFLQWRAAGVVYVTVTEENEVVPYETSNVVPFTRTIQ